LKDFGVRPSHKSWTDPSAHQRFYCGSQPVGFWFIARDDCQISLERLSLLPAFQNRGLGSAFLRELIAEARASRRNWRFVRSPGLATHRQNHQ